MLPAPVLPAPDVPELPAPEVPAPELPVPELPAPDLSPPDLSPPELPVAELPALELPGLVALEPLDGAVSVAAPPAPVPLEELLCPLGWPDLLLGHAIPPAARSAARAAFTHQLLVTFMYPSP